MFNFQKKKKDKKEDKKKKSSISPSDSELDELMNKMPKGSSKKSLFRKK